MAEYEKKYQKKLETIWRFKQHENAVALGTTAFQEKAITIISTRLPSEGDYKEKSA